MTWNTWKLPLALGAVLVVGGAVGADDRDLLRTVGGSTGTTMTLGGKGSVEQAATEDTELTGGYRGYYGGYRGGYYGGYRGGYYGGYRGGYYGGYGSYYRPAYYGGYYGGFYRPVYYSNFYAYPVYRPYYGGIFIGISGNDASGAPAVNLGGASRPMAQPTAPGDGTFRYDGGPANPVPLPKADPQMNPPSNSSATADLPVSLKAKPATSPYKYKAYGEK